MAESAYRARQSFTAAAIAGGEMRRVSEGDWVKPNDPVLKNRREMFQPMSEYVEQATAAPGEKRLVGPPTAQRNRQTEGDHMTHHLPPEDPNSAASPFAPGQPAAGVVADDVPPEQNPAGGPKAADAPKIEQTPPEPQTPQQAANAKAAEAAKTTKTTKK